MWEPEDLNHGSILFTNEIQLVRTFTEQCQTPPELETKRVWGLKILRALLLIEGEGIDFEYMQFAWGNQTTSIDLRTHLLETIGFPNFEMELETDSLSDDGEDDMYEDEAQPISLHATVPTSPSLSNESSQADYYEIESRAPIVSHRAQFTGHCNVQTVKDLNFYGLEDEYVVSGSDDGSLFIWDKKTSEVINILRGDAHIVNVATGHPTCSMIAVSGLESTVKVFSPERPAPRHLGSRRQFDQAEMIMSTNDVHREQALQDTYITRSMLQTMASRIRAQREQGNEQALENCTIS